MPEVRQNKLLRKEKEGLTIIITAKPCMESATCCGMELIAKQSYGIKPQKNAPLVMPYAYGDSMHAVA